MLVLTVKVYQAAARVPQRGTRCQHAVDGCAAASKDGYLTADDRLPAVGGFENGFDGRLLLPCPDELGGGATSDQETDGPDQDALARPCLSGQNREPRLKLEFETIDDCEMLNSEKAEHWTRSAILS